MGYSKNGNTATLAPTDILAIRHQHDNAFSQSLRRRRRPPVRCGAVSAGAGSAPPHLPPFSAITPFCSAANQ
jgi:hypothetical protein